MKAEKMLEKLKDILSAERHKQLEKYAVPEEGAESAAR